MREQFSQDAVQEPTLLHAFFLLDVRLMCPHHIRCTSKGGFTFVKRITQVVEIPVWKSGFAYKVDLFVNYRRFPCCAQVVNIGVEFGKRILLVTAGQGWPT